MIYSPQYVERIMKYTDEPFVKILTGVRRCGKSTILKMIMEELLNRGICEEKILSYRFDSMEYEGITAKEMFAEIKGKLAPDEKTYLFLDEVQEVNHWEKAVNSLASDYNVDICVQVTKEIKSAEIEKREYNRLLEIRDNYPKYILTTDAFSGGNYEGIKTMHVADFLLSDEF